MNVKELTPDQIDYWVARALNIQIIPAEGESGYLYHPRPGAPARKWSPSRQWGQGGPLIERFRVDLNWDWEQSSEWTASMEPDINAQGATILEAAMRAFIISRLGEEVG